MPVKHSRQNAFCFHLSIFKINLSQEIFDLFLICSGMLARKAGIL
jgi:hypothetical protein